tara:strand:+ start:290 stop:625 length:336 start_codon:yes stop_codon:yes gene_type:complete
MIFLIKILFAGLIIAFSSWLAGQYPKIAGFIIALPMASMIAIIFSYVEHSDPEKSVTFAKSILIGVPATYFFFLPFFFAKSLGMNFWLIYFIGLAFLVIAFFIHKYLVSFI